MLIAQDIKIQKINWYGFVHEKISERFGPMEFLNSFCILDEYQPVSVYRCLAPDRSKGHKDYFLIQLIKDPDGREHGADKSVAVIRGLNEAEIAPFRYQEGLLCFQCKEVIFSVMRHDMRPCGCKAVYVDGGRDYLHLGGAGYPAGCRIVTLDLLNDVVIPDPLEPTVQ